jgi:RNA polymerase sigma-70 factor (ECF subfamily)
MRLLGQSALAEDIVQETLVRLWQAGPNIDNDDTRTVMAWLYRTCTRLAIDVLRKRRSFEVLPAENALIVPCAVAHEDAVVARRLIAALVKHIPDDELEAALLCRVDGLSQPETAALLGISERTVRRLLERFDANAERWRREFGL